MSIELHCPQCEKLIRAPDNAGGRHGRCPHCNAEMYIPMPSAEDDVIPLAPVDEQEERREAELHREAVRYAAAFDKDMASAEPPPESEPGAKGARRSASAPAPGEVVDIGDEVERYVEAMRDSKLDEADRVVAVLKRVHTRAHDYVEGLILDPAPPPIGNVPKPLMQGFLKSLLHRLK